MGKYTKSTRERREREIVDKVGGLYAIRDDNGDRVYTYDLLAKEIGQSSTRVGKILDKYFAPSVAEMWSLHDENGERLHTKESIAKELGINKRQVYRIFKDHADVVEPPEPEPEGVEQEPSAEVEATPEPEQREDSGDETDVDEDDADTDEESKRIHTEMQWKLLWLGNKLGLSIWVANTDRNKSYEGKSFNKIPRMLPNLPTKILVTGPRSIERIDVLWLEDDSIIAAFEVENSTKIDSGLLRMSDMFVAMDDLSIRTYVVASEDDLHDARRKMNRPTFKKIGLTASCRYIPYNELRETFKKAEQNGYLCNTWQELLDTIGHEL